MEKAEVNPWNILPDLSHTKEQDTYSLIAIANLCVSGMQAWAPEGVDLFQLGWCDCRGYRDAVAVLLRGSLNNFLPVIY